LFLTLEYASKFQAAWTPAATTNFDGQKSETSVSESLSLALAWFSQLPLKNAKCVAFCKTKAKLSHAG
jgi:hypothetical protein